MSTDANGAQPRRTRPGTRERSGIADVAALAGVSQGTVSNVLNHPERVTQSTRDKVERAIEMLQYTPHGPARSLAVGSTRALGLVLTDLGNSLFVDIARGVEQRAAEAGAVVLLANTDADLEREQRALRMLAETRVMGTLLTLNDTRHYRRVVAADRGEAPLVLLNYAAEDDAHCSVHVDNVRGGAIAAEHLWDIGRRRIAVIDVPATLQPIIERRRGFDAVLASHQASAAAVHAVEGLTRAHGFAAGLALVPRIEAGEIDSVFAMADLVAAGIAQAVRSRTSLRIPEDFAIVGYDDNQASWDSPTPLTTVAQPGEAMGYAGAGLVLDELANDDHDHSAIDLEPSLVVRNSTVRP
ncbi:LacI family DNA-binding transcriptional regulator [uncultured Demequina sp.]|uniref:LacI family DNA-binding transcriptional regulator n=1 Tax=uncultured Demequina sp. TaxID=693499 RepID=UPI0025FBDB3E|nr:LacI family DNA-binding transcriptional regulator [uncultured Demequina sp.]